MDTRGRFAKQERGVSVVQSDETDECACVFCVLDSLVLSINRCSYREVAIAFISSCNC